MSSQDRIRPDDTPYEIPLTPRPYYTLSNGPPFMPLSPLPQPRTPQESALEAAPADATPPATTALQPYLGLWSRLLLTIFNPALLPLFFTVAHLAQTRASTETLAARLRDSVMSACSGLATGAGALQAMPRYLAMQTNKQVLAATKASVLAVGKALMDCVKIMEAVLNFIVDMYRSLLLCTIQLVVQGTLEVLIGAVRAITDGITSALNSIRTEIQNDLSAGNSLIEKAVSGVNTLGSPFGIHVDPPQITIPSLDFLSNVQIPTGFEDSLVKLNSSIPNLDELKQKLTDLIDTPFEELIVKINTTRLDLASTLNDSLLPVPSLRTLGAGDTAELQHSLCNGIDTSLIDDTARSLYKLGTIAIGLLFLVIALCWIALGVWEWLKWRAIRSTIEAVEAEWARSGNQDPWMVVAAVEHPLVYRYGVPVLNRIGNANTSTNLRWFISYLGHPTCLALLCLSVLGLIIIQCQIAALNGVRDHVSKTANETVAASTNDLVNRFNALSANASKSYALDANKAILGIQDKINHELFGHWVNTTAVTLNATLVNFYSEVENALNITFGGTILFNPVNTFIYCILGSKVTNLEKGLTWISEHAFLNLTTLPDDVLQLSDASMREVVSPISAAMVGSSPGPDGSNDGGAIGELVQNWERALRAEELLYVGILGLYGLLVLIALMIVVWHSGLAAMFLAWKAKRAARRAARPAALEEPPIHVEHKHVEPLETLEASKQTGTGTWSSLTSPGNAFLKMSGYLSTPSSPEEYRPPPPVQAQAPPLETNVSQTDMIREYHEKYRARSLSPEDRSAFWIDNAVRRQLGEPECK